MENKLVEEYRKKQKEEKNFIPKRAALFHDLSGFGKCSLTVALPVLSAAGIEGACIPTAVLSTHTGGFKDYTFRDLTEDLPAFLKHWEDLGLTFDALYSGYLGSPEQAEILAGFYDTLGSALFFVDPVMADNGELYPGFDGTMVEAMRKVAKKADVLLPNMTEAAFLLDIPYRKGPYTEDYVKDVARKLGELGPDYVVLTGIGFNEESTGAFIYDKNKGSFSHIRADLLPGMFHGTGDVFSSFTLAGLLNGLSLEDAVKNAVELTSRAIAKTIVLDTPPRDGVAFEHTLPMLSERVGMKRE